MEEKNESKVVHVTVASPDYSDEDVIDNPGQPGVKVDLERLKSGYTGKLHSQSNLPNVLTEYGMEEKENKYKVSNFYMLTWVNNILIEKKKNSNNEFVDQAKWLSLRISLII